MDSFTDGLPYSLSLPAIQVRRYGFPVRELGWQHPPRTMVGLHIAKGIEDLTDIYRARATEAMNWDKSLCSSPLLVAQFGWIGSAPQLGENG